MNNGLISNRVNQPFLTILLLAGLLLTPLAVAIPSAVQQLAHSLPPAAAIEPASPALLPAAGYEFHTNTATVLARNAQQGFELSIDSAGVAVRDLNARWDWQLSLARWGYAGALNDLADRAAGSTGSVRAQEYERQFGESLSEWYRNSPGGLEHGFTITTPPVTGTVSGQPLVLEMEYRGTYTPRLLPDSSGFQFLDREGAVQLQYDRLAVYDAAGRVVPAWMQAAESPIEGVFTLAIQVDDRGARYPLTVDPYLTVFSAELLASDGGMDDQFGRSVAVSGDIAVVGAPGDSPSDPSADPNVYNDAAYIFYRNQDAPDGWGEVIKLEPPDGSNADQTFGHSVAVAGNIVAVGAPTFDEGAQTNRGIVYIYYRNAGGSDQWELVKEVEPPAGMTGDKFGWDVALDGLHLVVGAPNDDNPAALNGGAVYIFGRNQGGAEEWGFITSLVQPDPQVNDRLGYAVDIHGDQIVAGAPYRLGSGGLLNQGAAYVFTVDPDEAGGWSAGREILAGDPASNDYFGWDVAVFHDHLVVGAPLKSSQHGAAYLFERNVGGVDGWGQVKKLLPLVSTNPAQFGVAVDLDHDSVVVGAYTWQQSIAFPSRGAAYIFERNQSGPDAWGQVVRLIEPSGAANSFFGRSVSIDESALIVGANGFDVGTELDQGAAFTYYRTGSSWELLAQPAPNDPAAGAAFGCSMATSTEYLAVGACHHNASQGKVYLYYRNQGGIENWGLLTTLNASDGSAGDLFGASLAIGEDKILAGAPGADNNQGAVYVFSRNQGGPDAWGEQQILADAGGAPGDMFGTAVDIFLDQAAVGAPGALGGQGEVTIFRRTVDTMLQEERWEAVEVRTDPVNQAGALGSAVAVTANEVLAGAPATLGSQGRAFLFNRNEGGADNWGWVKTFALTTPLAGDEYGAAVDLFSGRAVVGAPGRSSQRGAAYLYGLNQGGADNWGLILIKSPGLAGDRLGEQVDLTGDMLAVSAPSANRLYTYKRNQGGADAWSLFQLLSGPEIGQQFGAGLSMLQDILTVGAPDTSAGAGAAYVYLLTEFFQDLAVEKTASTVRVGPGDLVRFDITFENQGDRSATNVVITDTLPAGLTDWIFTTGGAAIVPGATQGVWTADSLGPGAAGTIAITGTVAADAISGTYMNTVEIAADEAEIYYNNNQAGVSFEVDTTAPAVPVRTSPLDNTIYTATNDITMEWRASTSPDVAGYLLDFNGNVINTADQRVTAANLVDGVYTWRIAAYDDLGNTSAYSSPWTFTVDTGLIENQPPVAVAGPNQSVLPGALVTIDGSASFDPDGQTPLSYQWSQVTGPPVGLTNGQSTFSFTAPDEPATLTFELIVRDVLGLASAPDRVTVQVSGSGMFEIHVPVALKTE